MKLRNNRNFVTWKFRHALPDAAEKPQRDKELVSLRKARHKDGRRVDKHGADEAPLPPDRVSEGAPDVSSDRHA